MKKMYNLNSNTNMENIDQNAKKMGLERGYYLLLMAILDIPVKNKNTKED